MPFVSLTSLANSAVAIATATSNAIYSGEVGGGSLSVDSNVSSNLSITKAWSILDVQQNYYLSALTSSNNGQQKYITNAGTSAITINTMSSNLTVLSSLSIKAGSTATLTWFNDYWYYMGNDPLLGPLSVNPTITAATLSWNKATNVGYSIVTLPSGSNTGQITGSSYNATSLTSNSTYTYIVTPYSSLGIVGLSNSITFTTLKIASIASLSVSNTTINGTRITWNIPTNVLYIIVTWPTGNTSGQQTGTFYNVTGLSINTSYTFTVTPYNSGGIAGSSLTTTVVTLPMITSASNSIVLSTSASISWLGATASYVIITWSGGTSGQQTISPYTATGLSGNTSYTFTVTPYNSANVAGTAVTTTFTTQPLATLSTATTSSVTTSSILVSWTGATNTSYVIVTWPGGTSGNQVGTSYTATGLSRNTSYTFTVTPYNSLNTIGTARTATAVTLPSITSATNSSITNSSALISWTGAVASYVIITWSGGTSGNQVGTSYTATGLTANTAYTFTVTPYNSSNVAGTAVTTTLTTLNVSFITTFSTIGTTSWTSPLTGNIKVLVVGGGGGGGGGYNVNTTYFKNGGGGAGGVVYNDAFAVTSGTSYTITIGNGGSGGYGDTGYIGGNSIFATITAYGGGGGGGYIVNGSNGGCGGGGGYGTFGTSIQTGMPGINYGTSGGDSLIWAGYNLGGGGGGAGGAGGVGTQGSPVTAGAGGNGISNSITGSAVIYSGGGGGSTNNGNSGGSGGTGGGGNGATGNTSIGIDATFYGGGGGGGPMLSWGGNGFKGVVIIAYP